MPRSCLCNSITWPFHHLEPKFSSKAYYWPPRGPHPPSPAQIQLQILACLILFAGLCFLFVAQILYGAPTYLWQPTH